MFTVIAIATIAFSTTTIAGALAAFLPGRQVREPGQTFEDLCGSSDADAFLAGLGF